MAEKNEDVWIKEERINWYSESLCHNFNDNKIRFELSHHHISKYDPLLITVIDGFRGVAGDDVLTFSFNGNIPAAKKMIENSIKYFKHDQVTNIYHFKDYFNTYAEIVKKPTSLAQLQEINEQFVKNSTVELPKQGETTSRREVKNINSKENLMSEVFEDREEETIAEEKELSPKQQAFIKAAREAAYDRKTVADAIRAGTLACLPGTDGYADTTPALNIMNIDNKYYHGANLLLIKEHQKQNGFPTGEYLTAFQIDKAKEEKPDLFIRQGQHGITIHVNEKNDQTGDWDEKDIKLFNVAQLNKPAVIKEWAEQKRQEKEQEKLEYLQTQYGTGYKPPEPKTREPGPEIVCSSTEPEKYLGQYLAAVSMGSKFKVSPEQSAEFSDKMIASIYKKMEPYVNKEGEIKQPSLNKETNEPITDSFSFIKISAAASQECKTFMRDLRIEAQKQNQPEQKQEQTQSLGRSM
jgi:hypothetical protein